MTKIQKQRKMILDHKFLWVQIHFQSDCSNLQCNLKTSHLMYCLSPTTTYTIAVTVLLPSPSISRYTVIQKAIDKNKPLFQFFYSVMLGRMNYFNNYNQQGS